MTVAERMILGNTDRFAIALRPVAPHWEALYVPERAAWAGLQLWVNGQNLCQHLLPGSDQVHDDLFVPLAPIADWLVHTNSALLAEERPRLFPVTRQLHHSLRRWGTTHPVLGMDGDRWLDEREAWWSRHFLLSGADGAQLPDLALSRDDEELVIDWSRPRFAGEPAPRFLAPFGNAAVRWTEGRAVLRNFIAVVGQSLQAAGLGAEYPWAALEDPLPDAQADLGLAVQLFTGRTRGELLELTGAAELGQALERLGLANSTDPGGSPASQALRDLPPALPKSFRELLAQLSTSTSTPNDLGMLRNARAAVRDAVEGAEEAEEAGQRAAVATRSLLGLNGEPIASEVELLGRLRISLVDSPVERVQERMLAGADLSRGATAIILSTPRTRTPWGHRFEAARALGHLLTDAPRGGAIGAAGSWYTTDRRRRRAGAFAAELLLPGSAIAHETNEELDAAAAPEVFESLMNKYGVGAQTAAHQLFNKGLLSSAAVRDDLIEACERRSQNVEF